MLTLSFKDHSPVGEGIESGWWTNRQLIPVCSGSTGEYKERAHMNIEWELSAYLAEAVALLEQSRKTIWNTPDFSEKVDGFLKRYKEEFQNDGCN